MWPFTRRETPEARDLRELTQGIETAGIALKQIFSGAHIVRGPIRPGTLTVSLGAESATLDPLAPADKFAADKRAVEGLLARASGASQ
jgi:hypothetical protein